MITAEVVLLLVAASVAYVGQVRGETSLYWLTAGLVATLIAAHLQFRRSVHQENNYASRSGSASDTTTQSLLERQAKAYALENMKEWSEAEKEFRKLFKSQRQSLGPEHIDTLNTRYDIGRMLGNQGKYIEAERELRETLRIQHQVLGPKHPHTVNTRRYVKRARMLRWLFMRKK